MSRVLGTAWYVQASEDGTANGLDKSAREDDPPGGLWYDSMIRPRVGGAEE